MRCTRTASPELVRSRRSAASRSSASRKNGLPPVASTAGGGEVGFDVAPQPAGAQRCGRLGAQRRRPEHRCLRAGRQPGQIGRPLPTARRCEDDETEAVQARRQVVEESERLGVGPLEIVDGEDDRCSVSQVVEQPVEAVEHGEGAIRRAGRQFDAARGEQRLRQGGGTVEHAFTLVDGCVGDHGLEQLSRASVGEIALQLRGAGAEADEAHLGGGLARRSQQARLAHPRGRLDDDDPPAGQLRLNQRASERIELALSLEQCRRALDHHSTSEFHEEAGHPTRPTVARQLYGTTRRRVAPSVQGGPDPPPPAATLGGRREPGIPGWARVVKLDRSELVKDVTT